MILHDVELSQDLTRIGRALQGFVTHFGLFGSQIRGVRFGHDIDVLIEVVTGCTGPVRQRLEGLVLSRPILAVDFNVYQRRYKSRTRNVGYHILVVESHLMDKFLCLLARHKGSYLVVTLSGKAAARQASPPATSGVPFHPPCYVVTAKPAFQAWQPPLR